MLLKKPKTKNTPHIGVLGILERNKNKNKTKTIVKELTQHSLSFSYTRDVSFSEEFLLHSWG